MTTTLQRYLHRPEHVCLCHGVLVLDHVLALANLHLIRLMMHSPIEEQAPRLRLAGTPTIGSVVTLATH